MKKHIPFTGIWVTVVLLAVIMACNPHEEKAVEPMGKPISELAAIDSLMWRQPDSALMLMLAFSVSPEADSLNVFEGHYCQLLISELLYKNYKPQSNRDELLRAVDYFDSLTLTQNDNPNPWNRHCGHDPQSPEQHDNLTFLDARAHYINGAGFYE